MLKCITRFSVYLIAIVLICTMVAGCGSIIGHTSPVKVKLPEITGKMPQFTLGMVDYDETKMLAQNTTPFKWEGARFSEKDLDNLIISLEKAIEKISGDKEILYINVIQRANFIAYSNSEGAMLSAIGWCISDEQKNIIFEDNFFVAKYHGPPTIYTLGGLKEENMEKVVERIMLTCMDMVNNNKNIKVPSVEETYDSYAAAVVNLPSNINFMYPPGEEDLFSEIDRYATDWQELGTMDPLAWDKILKRNNQ